MFFSCDVGIEPNGNTYSLESIKDAIKQGVGYTPFVECNNDSSGNSQLYQIYHCVDNSASKLIECPVFPRGRCGSQIEFPTFWLICNQLNDLGAWLSHGFVALISCLVQMFVTCLIIFQMSILN